MVLWAPSYSPNLQVKKKVLFIVPNIYLENPMIRGTLRSFKGPRRSVTNEEEQQHNDNTYLFYYTLQNFRPLQSAGSAALGNHGRF